jgi:hypothetical protein
MYFRAASTESDQRAMSVPVSGHLKRTNKELKFRIATITDIIISIDMYNIPFIVDNLKRQRIKLSIHHLVKDRVTTGTRKHVRDM